MGMFNYNKAGPGVNKDGPKKKRFFYFFELAWRKIGKLVQLNLLYVLFMLPTILVLMLMFAVYVDVQNTINTAVEAGEILASEATTQFIEALTPGLLELCIPLVLTMLLAGPATAAITYDMRCLVTEKGFFVWDDFKDAFKKNWKQGMAAGVIDGVAVTLMLVALPFYYERMTDSIMYLLLFGICLVISLIFIMMNYYIYLMIVSTNLTLKQIFKNSLILVGAGMKTNIITTVFVFLLLFPLIFFLPSNLVPFTLIFYLLILPALACMVICYNSFQYIQKYVIDPYYEEHQDEKPQIEGEAVFTDIGDKEKPMEQPKSRRSSGGKVKKGKKIS